VKELVRVFTRDIRIETGVSIIKVDTDTDTEPDADDSVKSASFAWPDKGNRVPAFPIPVM